MPRFLSEKVKGDEEILWDTEQPWILNVRDNLQFYLDRTDPEAEGQKGARSASSKRRKRAQEFKDSIDNALGNLCGNTNLDDLEQPFQPTADHAQYLAQTHALEDFAKEGSLTPQQAAALEHYQNDVLIPALDPGPSDDVNKGTLYAIRHYATQGDGADKQNFKEIAVSPEAPLASETVSVSPEAIPSPSVVPEKKSFLGDLWQRAVNAIKKFLGFGATAPAGSPEIKVDHPNGADTASQRPSQPPPTPQENVATAKDPFVQGERPRPAGKASPQTARIKTISQLEKSIQLLSKSEANARTRLAAAQQAYFEARTTETVMQAEIDKVKHLGKTPTASQTQELTRATQQTEKLAQRFTEAKDKHETLRERLTSRQKDLDTQRQAQAESPQPPSGTKLQP